MSNEDSFELNLQLFLLSASDSWFFPLGLYLMILYLTWKPNAKEILNDLKFYFEHISQYHKANYEKSNAKTDVPYYIIRLIKIEIVMC